jgi:hypothetical protein
MSKFSDLGVDRVIDELRSFMDRPRTEIRAQKDMDLFRELMTAVVDLSYGSTDATVVCEVYDARRETVKTIRVPHAHLIRDPHGMHGVSLSEAMASIELMALTASAGIRSVAAEVASQEREREVLSRHIALCEPVRRWGESLSVDKPHLSSLLITFATEAKPPKLIDAADAEYLGFGSEQFHELLDPGRIDDLRSCLVEMAKVKLA